MPSQVIEASAHSTAPRETVWGVIADARRWSDWGPWDRAALEQTGDEDENGVGAIRVFTKRPLRTRELVTAFEPPQRLCYQLLTGLPLRGYTACITLAEADGGGTEIRWHSEFDPKIPGTGAFFRRWLTGVLHQVADRAAREAERQAAAG